MARADISSTRVQRVRPSLGALLLLAIALSACTLYTTPATVPVPMGAQSTAPRDPFQALLARSRDLGPLPASRTVSFLALLRVPSGGRQSTGLTAMYDPHSRAFGHYQTVQQWASHSGPPPRAVLSARTYLQHAGIATTWQPGDGSLVVRAQAK